MSFVNAGQAIQRFLYDQQYNTPYQEGLAAVLFARRFNTTIREETNEFLDGPGKLRQLKVSYYPIQCDVVDDDTETIDLCATGTVQAPIQNFYTIQKLLKSKTYTLYPDDLRYVDGNFTLNTHVMNQIATILGALEKQLSIDAITDIIAHKGVHLDGSEFGQRIAFSNTTNGLMTPVGLWAIEKEQMDAAYPNTFLVGHTEVFNWRKAFDIATDNTYYGQDFTKLAVRNLYYDVNLNTIMGVSNTDPEYILTFTPQALKFVGWNRNAGMWATTYATPADMERVFKSANENVIRGIFQSPKYGLVWDFYANYKPCVTGQYSGQWNWHLELNWDILYTPVQTCNPQGVNGIMLYRTCPVKVPDCPTGTALSPSVNESTFSYNPNFSYPLLVSNLLLAGQQSYPNATVANDTELTALFNASISGYSFTLNGSNIEYDGFSAITGSLNGTSVTFS